MPDRNSVDLKAAKKMNMIRTFQYRLFIGWMLLSIIPSATIADERKVETEIKNPASSNAGSEVTSLETVENPPLVQMLIPGFSVRELPVALTNVNNLRYRSDGQLYALGYNGNIWLLSDQDADGLEETKHLFFENSGRLRGPIGMAVIPDGHALLADSIQNGKTIGRGVVVASKGKVSAILDLDGDDIAEQERIIASGWVEIPQNVDAIGVAFHPVDGSIYFGVGVKDYNKAYQLDADGKSQFDLSTERGTIQRIEPDLSARKTVCTGVRFTIGLEFDEHHELFATEQEGATWLPNGNPFDELLHIRSSRHYGFPPRHPQHLPSVFDEPSLFDYRPQHQSTCGLAFNLPFKSDSPIFGPPNWRGDAFVCGESRGKLYRTHLERDSENEYVATNQLIGCLSMLTVDCCISPRGDLIVACHSGGPDWGSGPSGKGRLFQLRYREPTQGQPIAIWAASPFEVRVEFDKPLTPESLKNLVSKTSITFGEYVTAADRFESIRPGYAATKRQQATSRYSLPVLAASVTPDRKTLILSTGQHQSAVTYAVTLPGLGRESVASDASALDQLPAIDLAYSLNGVHAQWKSADSQRLDWEGWLPHLDLQLARSLTKGQSHVAALWERLSMPGTLTLKTQLDPRGLFYPAVQPNSTLDYPPEKDLFVTESTFQLQSLQPFTSGNSDDSITAADAIDGHFLKSISVPLRSSECIPLLIEMKTGAANPSLQIDWSARLQTGTNRSGSIAIHRFLLPWAEPIGIDELVPKNRTIKELVNASWGRGRRLFLSEKTGCSKCHVAHGVGGSVGPDLSNLVHRDYDSVLRDVKQPSFSINPDYISYKVLLKDSRVLVGALRSDGDQYSISDQQANVTSFSSRDIDELQATALSNMPEGIVEKLEPTELNDLLAFLLQKPPHMPIAGKMAPPRLRRLDEIERAIDGSDPAMARSALALNVAREALKPLNILLVAGKKDHGLDEHDYPAWLRMWSDLMSAAESVTINTAMEWPSDEQILAADTIVFFQKGKWNPERAAAIDTHLARGKGLVYIHWAIEGGRDAPLFAQRIGLASDSKETKYRHGPIEPNFRVGSQHPIARNFDSLELVDESYWKLHGDPTKIQTIATVVEEGQVLPLFWTMEPNHGRVFVSIPGHYSWTFDDPLFRVLLLRGIAWSANESVDRFNELVLLGVSPFAPRK